MLHAIDGLLGVAHFFVNEAEVVDDIFFNGIHDQKLGDGVGEGLGGEVEHAAGGEALTEQTHCAHADIRVLAGFLEFGNRLLPVF